LLTVVCIVLLTELTYVLTSFRAMPCNNRTACGVQNNFTPWKNDNGNAQLTKFWRPSPLGKNEFTPPLAERVSIEHARTVWRDKTWSQFSVQSGRLYCTGRRTRSQAGSQSVRQINWVSAELFEY